MNPLILAGLVDRGHALHSQISTLQAELKTINDTLKVHALIETAHHIPLQDETREGTQLPVVGSKVTVPVVCTTDLITQSFAPESDLHKLLAQIAGGEEPLQHLYLPVTRYEAVASKANSFDGRRFRAVAREVLPDPDAFISAAIRRSAKGIPVSAVKIEWDAAKPNTSPAPVLA